jgi:hypothetical protein
MRSLIEFLLAIAITVVILLLIGLFLPGGDHGHVERSIIIERPSSHVFDALNSFKRFNEWSPWAKKDTAASYTYSGPEIGQGAQLAFSGNEKMGTGHWEILESTPTSLVKMNQVIDNGRIATIVFDVVPSDLGVKVTWSYDTELGINPIERVKGQYLDSSIGGDFQYGLMRLKALLESSAYARDYSDILISAKELPSQPALKLASLVEVYSAAEQTDLTAGVIESLKTVQAVADRNNLIVTGPAQVTVTLKERYRLAFDVVLPVDRNDVPMSNDVQAVQTLSGPVLTAEHVGERDKMKATIEKMQAYATIRGLPFDTTVKPVIEILPDRPAPLIEGVAADAADAAAAAAAAEAAVAAAAAGTPAVGVAPVAGAPAEVPMVQVTRIYLPLLTAPLPVDAMGMPIAAPAAAETPATSPEPAPAGG